MNHDPRPSDEAWIPIAHARLAGPGRRRPGGAGRSGPAGGVSERDHAPEPDGGRAPAGHGPAPAPQVSTPVRVMLVDDELDVLRSTEMLLARSGFACRAVADHRQVFDECLRYRPDVLFLDVVMPGIDLSGLLASLRGHPETAEIPVVLFSASPELPDVAARLDVAGYLAKPFDELELMRRIADATGRPAPRGPQEAVPVESHAPDALRHQRRQAVRDYFHEYWQDLTAISTYAQFLINHPGLDESGQEASKQIRRIVLELERKTDVLRSRLLAFVG